MMPVSDIFVTHIHCILGYSEAKL